MPDLQKGLIGHWTLNDEDTDGSIIRDRSAYDNHGSLTGGGSFGKNGPLGNSVELDGYSSGSRIELGSDNLLNPNNVTVSAWVYPYDQGGNYSSYSYNYIYSNARDCCNPYNGIDFRITNGNVDFGICNGDRYNATGGSPSSEVWSHVIGTYDGSTIKVYLNGNQVASNGYTGGVGNPSTYDNYIGGMGHGPGQYTLDGKLSNLRVYNRALSESEINQLYNFRGNSRKSQTTVVAGDSLQAWYPFLQSGAADKSGNGNDGTVNGATYNGSGGPEGLGAYEFDGSGDTVETSTFSTPSNQITVSAWLKPSQISGDNRQWAVKDEGANQGFRSYVSGGNSVHWKVDGNEISGSGIPVDEWSHLALTWDSNSGDQIIYIDTVIDTTGFYTGSITDDNDKFYIGGDGFQNYDWYEGEIADVRVYNRALSESEINQLYDPKSVNLDQGLVGHWSMDDSDVSGGTLYDRSAYDNHGTLKNNPSTGQSGIVGKSFSFDGSDDRVDLPNSSIPEGDEISISMWTYGNESFHPSDNSIIEATKNGDRVVNIHHPWGNENIYWDTGNGSGGSDRIQKSVSSSVYEGRWAHWVYMKDANAGEKKIYLDGELWHSGSGYTQSFVTPDSVSIGSYAGGGREWGGRISDIRIYNRALTEKEINALYNKRTTSSIINSNQIIWEDFFTENTDGSYVKTEHDSRGSTTNGGWIWETADNELRSDGSNSDLTIHTEQGNFSENNSVTVIGRFLGTSDDDGVGPCIYDKSQNKWYVGEITNGHGVNGIGTISGGNVSQIAGGDNYDVTKPHTFELKYENGTLSFYVDGNLSVQTNQSLSPDGFGFLSDACAPPSFWDYLIVKRI